MKNVLIKKYKYFGSIIIILSGLLACKKTNPTSSTACAAYDGSFEITIDGNTYDMVVDTTTNFTILYNWFGYQESNFVIYASDQNGNSMNVEFAVPGTLSTGSSTFTYPPLYSDFFDIDVDTFSLYVSSVTFEVTESNFSSQEGVYKPIAATFSGTAHSYPWTNGQPPIDTLSFSGSFCLNVFILP